MSCLVTVPFPRTAAVTIHSSQVTALVDCQKEWGVTMEGWAEGGECTEEQAYIDEFEGGNPMPDWQKPRGILCDGDGMVTIMHMAGEGLRGSIPASIGSLIQLSYLCGLASTHFSHLPLLPETLHCTS
ncbi:unnamed protein product [Closterium sp. NIES-65]|nr:unnamed protein product [Closterium sp. NIES-65]